MTPSGLARTEIEVVDISTIINTGLKGIVGFAGITERGPVSEPVLIGSWTEYQRVFGGLMTTSEFPHLCKRALEAGGRLKISRVAHYSNLSDKTSIEGTKATLAKSQLLVAGTEATAVFTITSTNDDDLIEISVNTGLGIIFLGSYVTGASEDATDVAAGLKAAINANTANTGYTADNTLGVLTVTAPLTDGANANSFTPLVTKPSTTVGTWGAVTFAGGVTPSSAYTITATAKSIGAWGNGITFQFKAPANGLANTVDLYVSLAGYTDLTEIFRNVPTVLTAGKISELNGKSKLVDFSGFTGTLAASDVLTLATGAQNVANIISADYVGDAVGGTGIHAFDSSSDITKIACPEIAVPVVDIALAAYADARKDILALLHTPVGLDGAGMIAYRQGTSPYSHAAINTWRAIMTGGGLKVTLPNTELTVEIPESGDVAGGMSRKDNSNFEWFSFSGQKRGRIKNCLGIVYDLGNPARQAIADAVDAAGINLVINHATFGPVLWGNSTLQKEDTLLKHANVAELMIYLTRGLKPLIESELFDPNDIETWKSVHRRVTPLMDYVKNNRGIWDYDYQGDQDIDDISQAVVNSPSNIDAGQYVFNLFISPKVGMKYAGVKVIVTNSGVDFSLLQES